MNGRNLLPLLATWIATATAMAGSSSNYSNTPTAFAAAGGSSASTHYSQTSTLGGTNASTVSGGVVVSKGGFGGQLYEIQNLHIYPVAPGNIPELGTLQLASFLVLDDSSLLAINPNTVAWSVEFGPVTSISASGLMKADAVTADTLAQIRADHDGRFALTQTTVINAIPGQYAGDALPDTWQDMFFGPNNPNAAPDADPTGTGQNNYFKYIAGLDPTDPASRFVVDVDPDPPTPGTVDIRIEPVFGNRTYTLFTATQLSPPNWTPVNSVAVPDGAGFRFSQTVTPGTNRFYRVEITFP